MRCPDGYTGDGRVCRGMAHIIFYCIHLVPGCTRKPKPKTKWTEPLFEDFHFFRELFIGMKFPVNRLHQWWIGIVILRIDFNFLLFRMLLSWRKKGEGSTQAETEIGQKGNLVFIPSLLPIMIQSLFHAWFTIDVQAPAISVPPGLFYFRRLGKGAHEPKGNSAGAYAGFRSMKSKPRSIVAPPCMGCKSIAGLPPRSMSPVPSRRARLELQTSRSRVWGVNRSATHVSTFYFRG